MVEEKTNINKPVVLRSVQNNSDANLKDAKKTGIIFECVKETNCPHCDTVVPLADSEPLSWLICPNCKEKVLVPGQVGCFLLHEHIGEGEMGTIYRATDESLKREVAVKVVRGCHINDPESRKRLQSEACAAGKLNHPRVAQVYALNFSNEHPYLVMELVAGEDFAQKLEHDGSIDEETALRMAMDVAEGLSALNSEGLVHGDIKPGNIVLDRYGNAKLVDFGLSGMTRHDDQGTLVGTPNYIAPELLRSEADTHRSDIYSLGATLYHMLSGELPFDGETSVDILKARLSSQPVPLEKRASQISLPTQKLVMQMLESDPKKRPFDSDAVIAEIKKALALLKSEMPQTAGTSAFAHHPGIRPKSTTLPQLPEPHSRFRIILILFLIAVIELMVAVKENSFSQTWNWLRTDAVSHIKTMSLLVRQLLPETDASALDDTLAEVSLVWQSINLGEHTKRGSTMQMGEVMIVQGTGKEMWKGDESCRYVCTKTSSNYVFSTQIQTIADNNNFDISGLLVKGGDPTLGPGLLFGFLGSGKLFLQIRQSSNSPVVIKCSEQPIRLPVYLKVIRCGYAFETSISVNGHDWEDFAACELELPFKNTIGLCVSSQNPNTLASAKFAGINLLALEMPDATQTNDVQVLK